MKLRWVVVRAGDPRRYWIGARPGCGWPTCVDETSGTSEGFHVSTMCAATFKTQAAATRAVAAAFAPGTRRMLDLRAETISVTSAGRIA